MAGAGAATVGTSAGAIWSAVVVGLNFDGWRRTARQKDAVGAGVAAAGARSPRSIRCSFGQLARLGQPCGFAQCVRGSTSYSPCPVSKSGLDRGRGMQGSEYGNRGNGGPGEIDCDILRDTGKAEDIDVQHLAGLPRRFEIRASVVPQTEVQAFAGGGLLDHVGVTLELIADRGSDEIRAVRIKSVLHHQIDMAEVDIAKIDRDFFSLRRLRPKFVNVFDHCYPSIYHLSGCYMDVRSLVQGAEQDLRVGSYSAYARAKKRTAPTRRPRLRRVTSPSEHREIEKVRISQCPR
jgi:hypothetical protein